MIETSRPLNSAPLQLLQPTLKTKKTAYLSLPPRPLPPPPPQLSASAEIELGEAPYDSMDHPSGGLKRSALQSSGLQSSNLHGSARTISAKVGTALGDLEPSDAPSDSMDHPFGDARNAHVMNPMNQQGTKKTHEHLVASNMEPAGDEPYDAMDHPFGNAREAPLHSGHTTPQAPARVASAPGLNANGLNADGIKASGDSYGGDPYDSIDHPFGNVAFATSGRRVGRVGGGEERTDTLSSAALGAAGGSVLMGAALLITFRMRERRRSAVGVADGQVRGARVGVRRGDGGMEMSK